MGKPIEVLRDQGRAAVGRRISENSFSSEDLDFSSGERNHNASGHPLCSSPPPSSESRKNQETPRLSETSVKDRLAKYQAAVSKQGSSSSQLVPCALSYKYMLYGNLESMVLPVSSRKAQHNILLRFVEGEEKSLSVRLLWDMKEEMGQWRAPPNAHILA
ncbi:UNVERIFIED_CONTAM: hypothetical protein K2H54_038080 [Gekko kuhli]